jgi:hypothetical protein
MREGGVVRSFRFYVLGSMLRPPNQQIGEGAALGVSRLWIGGRSIAYIAEKTCPAAAPVGVGRIEPGELTCTPERRVYPSVISTTIVGVDTPGS